MALFQSIIEEPDLDPEETEDWLAALESVFDSDGVDRAHYLIERLIDQMRRQGAHLPHRTTTAYVNTIPAAQEQAMLEQYFGVSPDRRTLASYHAMKCASLLRETMWSMVSELNSRVDMDFADYTQKNLQRFETVYAEYRNNYA